VYTFKVFFFINSCFQPFAENWEKIHRITRR